MDAVTVTKTVCRYRRRNIALFPRREKQSLCSVAALVQSFSKRGATEN